MGLLSEILLLPLAPVRGSGWVIRQVLAEAERRYDDPAAVTAELRRLEELLVAGELDEEEFDRLEDELLDRLERSRGASGGVPWTGDTGDWNRSAAPPQAGATPRHVEGG